MTECFPILEYDPEPEGILEPKRLIQPMDVPEHCVAAFFAVSQFRQVVFAQILYGGDLVLPGAWDGRGWEKRESIRQRLFWLAAEACLEL